MAGGMGPVRHYLLGADHHPVDEAAEQHDQADQDVHHPDLLVVDRGQPLAPYVADLAVVEHRHDHADAGERGEAEGADDDRVVIGNRRCRQPSEDGRPRTRRIRQYMTGRI
jgi:hypothetical protein